MENPGTESFDTGYGLFAKGERLNKKMSMKCSNHRNANALGQCSKCGIPVCEVCNRSEKKDVLMCEACTMLSTFSVMRKRKKDIDEKRSEKKLEEATKKVRRRSTLITSAIVITLIIVILEVMWYMSLSKMDNIPSEPLEDYFTITFIMNNAIESYKEDNKGKAPDSMEVLLGKYLPDNDMWKGLIKEYHYNKIPPDQYDLTPPLISDGRPDVVFSDEGLYIVGF